MRPKYHALLIASLALISPSLSFASPEAAQKIDLKGSVYEIQLEPSDAQKTSLTLWGESKGNFSQALRLAIAGPVGLKGKIQGKYVASGNLEAALQEVKGWQDISLENQDGKDAKINLTQARTAALISKTSTRGRTARIKKFALRRISRVTGLQTAAYNAGDIDKVCGVLPPDQLAYYVSQLNRNLGTNFTVESYCQREKDFYASQPTPNPSASPSGSATPTGTPDDSNTNDNSNNDDLFVTDPVKDSIPNDVNYVSSGLLKGRLSKNACKNSGKYLIRVVLDLSGINPAVKNTGYSIAASVATIDHKGSRAASIKPKSDGKYAGKPIVLMAALSAFGSSGGQSIRAQTFNALGIPRTYFTTRQIDFIFYNGVFARAPISGALRGGRVNFEYISGDSIYSVCFSGSATRQNINGYKGPAGE